ncbi:Inner membrane protein YbhL [Polaribacter huanghezhanensis]|uniref:Bax inhibitor-1/YccA family protein n=1 Tax=Polaribacter huanghezhanensis TaxID=1354726 RepID=UPI002648327C|nr:Bax inhibitor-1/YccA family protein [Polaribacter huanghezhanensis]WKD85986.1 Inner membrane protein YbhL [Polaribacter huanghezhanensis]
MEIRNYTNEQVQTIQAAFMSKVYTWMSGGLAITGLIAMWVASTPEIINYLLLNQMLFFGLMIGEIFLVGYLITVIKKISAQTAAMIFTGYAALNGLTLSVVFLIYTSQSIATTFFVTAGTFAIMSIYGYYTKKDLTSWGNLLFMALIGIIIASVVNIFMKSEMMYWLITYAGVFIFVGLTAYDTQKIKRMSVASEVGSEEESKSAIVGALMLYLDFINLFLLLLRILGDRK